MADHQFRTGSRLTFDELAKETGIHRTILSKIANTRIYNTTTDNIDNLCRFFSARWGILWSMLSRSRTKFFCDDNEPKVKTEENVAFSDDRRKLERNIMPS